VIHFNATQAVLMGREYFAAYQRAMGLTAVVPSAKTSACNGTDLPGQTISQCSNGL
jgi:hypothetical protein